MNCKYPVFVLLLGFIFLVRGEAGEYKNGSLVLALDTGNGRFSLYAADDNGQGRGKPLFSHPDPRTSFLSVLVNDRAYKLGDTSAFKISLGGDEQKPSLVFESPSLLVVEEFSFLDSRNQTGREGVKITITLQNRLDQPVNAGARFLLDTMLGEAPAAYPVVTDLRKINSEILLTKTDGDSLWTDRNSSLFISGSLFTGAPEDPDSVHFANWKKLSDVSWKAAYQKGRNFNFSQYSVGDTALCYYFESRQLDRDEKRTFSFSLYGGKVNASAAPDQAIAPAGESAQDLAALADLTARIDRLIESGTVSEEELASIESAINRLRAKYGLGSYSR